MTSVSRWVLKVNNKDAAARQRLERVKQELRKKGQQQDRKCRLVRGAFIHDIVP